MYNCECGTTLKAVNIKTHFQSKKHKKYVDMALVDTESVADTESLEDDQYDNEQYIQQLKDKLLIQTMKLRQREIRIESLVKEILIYGDIVKVLENDFCMC